MAFKALEPSVAVHVPLAAVNRIAAADPRAWFDFGALGYVNTERAVAVGTELLIRRADRRLAAALLRLCAGGDVAPGVDELRLSQAELGEIVNASRHVVNRILAAFERRGWIEVGYGRIAIRDAEALGAMAAGEVELDAVDRAGVG